MNMYTDYKVGVTVMPGYSYYSRGKNFRVKMTVQDSDGEHPFTADATMSDNLDGWTTSSKSPTTLTFNFKGQLQNAGLKKGAKTTKIEFFESTGSSFTWPAAVNAVCLYRDTLN